MIGIGRVLKIALMAGEAIHRRAGVAIIDMAQITGHRQMRARKWKARAVVIEVRRPPGITVMASQTIMWIIAGHMIRIRGVLKIRLMARKTIFRRAGKTAIHMTLGAINGIMRTQQWKCCTAMIEGRRFPGIHGVTLRTRMRKICRHVIRISRTLKISLMTGKTIRRGAGETIVGVTLIASDRGMCPEQRKARFVVIISRRSPRVIVVANLAVFGKIAGDVIRVRRILKIVLMAGETIFRRADKTAIHMALRAINAIMRPQQWKRCAVMIEGRWFPDIHGVTLRTGVREIRRSMIRIGRALKVGLMARKAFSRGAGETIVHVTLIASDCRMRTEQRKTCFAVIETLAAETCDLPTGNRAVVALLAAHGKTGLAMIRIGGGVEIFLMAGAALQRQIDELRCALLRVAVITADMLMQPEQRKARSLMHRRNL